MARKRRTSFLEDVKSAFTPQKIRTQQLKDANKPVQPLSQPQDAPPAAPVVFPSDKDNPVLALAREKGLSLKSAADILLAKSRQSPEKRLAQASAADTNVQMAQQEQGAQNQELLSQAQNTLLTPEELRHAAGSDVNIGQAIGAGFANLVPSTVGGAAGGAAIGAFAGGVGAIPGAVIGGVGGAITGFLSGVRTSIKSQQSDAFAADQTALTKGSTYLKSLITDTNQNPENAAENIELFYKTLNMIDAAHNKTRKDSEEDLNKWLGNDGSVQLAKFDVFDTTMKQYYISRFQTALNAPNPNDIMIGIEDIDAGLQ